MEEEILPYWNITPHPWIGSCGQTYIFTYKSINITSIAAPLAEDQLKNVVIAALDFMNHITTDTTLYLERALRDATVNADAFRKMHDFNRYHNTSLTNIINTHNLTSYEDFNLN